MQAQRDRRASGTELVASDTHKGLVRAIEEVFWETAWQRCAVHLMRGCMREGGRGARGGRARCARVTGLPALALEETARQPRDKARVEYGAGVPLRKITGHGGWDSHVQPGRDVVGIGMLLGKEDNVDARCGAPNGHVGHL